jgi:pyrroloquinoline quinone biosynthesis protein D
MTTARPSFAKGVRFRAMPDGSALLLVPEGALMLNGSAAAALELVDGSRSLDDITAALVEQFEVSEDEARSDVDALFTRLAERQFVVL